MASSLLKRLGAYEMAAVVADRAFRAASDTGSGLLIGAAKMGEATRAWEFLGHARAATAVHRRDDATAGLREMGARLRLAA
jgi:hypothetical protein